MHWSAKQQKVKLTNPNAKRWNVMLTDKRLKAEKALLEIDDDINNKTADELKEIIIAKNFPQKPKLKNKKDSVFMSLQTRSLRS